MSGRAGSPGWSATRQATPWPDLARARDAGSAWFGARSRAQRGVLLAVVGFLLLGFIGALADTESPSTIGSEGPASSDSAQPTAGPTLGATAATTTLAAIPPPVVTARVAEGVPPGGDDTTVVRVIDGDTMEMAAGIRVRLIGIDTPETVEPGMPVQCFGPEATRYVNEITPPGTRVRLVYDVARTDRFGRTLAYVYKLDDGLFVNRAIARNGFALQSTVPPNVAHAEEFRLAVAEARDANLGLWRTCQSTTTAAPSTTASRVTTPAPAPAPTTGPTVAAATPCTATVSDASPTRNSTVMVLISSEYPSSSASATAHYKTTDTTNQSTTDNSGAAAIAFRISSATPGYRVVIDVTVAGTSRCQTSFTPIG